jgi:general secretion pathway protein I
MFQVPSSRFRVERLFRVSSFELGNRIPGSKNPKPETRNPKRPPEAGFTLLEVIVALAILGVGFALAIELLATGVRSAKASGDYTQAVLLARQKMAEIAATPSLEGLASAGEFGGGFRWASEVHPLPQEEDLAAQLYQVRVRIAWPGRRGEKSLDLYTLRMAVDEKKLGQTRAVPPGGR